MTLLALLVLTACSGDPETEAPAPSPSPSATLTTPSQGAVVVDRNGLVDLMDSRSKSLSRVWEKNPSSEKSQRALERFLGSKITYDPSRFEVSYSVVENPSRTQAMVYLCGQTQPANVGGSPDFVERRTLALAAGSARRIKDKSDTRLENCDEPFAKAKTVDDVHDDLTVSLDALSRTAVKAVRPGLSLTQSISRIGLVLDDLARVRTPTLTSYVVKQGPYRDGKDHPLTVACASNGTYATVEQTFYLTASKTDSTKVTVPGSCTKAEKRLKAKTGTDRSESRGRR